MKYIVATTDNTYFRWQILVQINNFKRLGILNDLTYVVSVKYKISKELKKIREATGARILTYRDERKSKKYASSVASFVMKKHFENYPEESKMFFYLDPDVLFTKRPDFPKTYYTSNKWILSDTKSYIDSKYIKSKSKELFGLMCNCVGIDKKTVIKYDNDAGGAQYIMKNANSEYWDKVERDSENLYILMKNTSEKYSPKHPIQSWTADMWAMLWNAWLFGHRTIIDKRMKFSWATSRIESYEKNLIHHNAGVFDQEYLFKKGLFFHTHPFNYDFSYVSKDYCSYKYVEEILDTKKNYLNLINLL